MPKIKGARKAQIVTDLDDIQVQANLYRNRNGVGKGGAMMTISCWAMPNRPLVGREQPPSVYDLDITTELSPEVQAALVALLDACDEWAEKHWGFVPA